LPRRAHPTVAVASPGHRRGAAAFGTGVGRHFRESARGGAKALAHLRAVLVHGHPTGHGGRSPGSGPAPGVLGHGSGGHPGQSPGSRPGALCPGVPGLPFHRRPHPGYPPLYRPHRGKGRGRLPDRAGQAFSPDAALFRQSGRARRPGGVHRPGYQRPHARAGQKCGGDPGRGRPSGFRSGQGHARARGGQRAWRGGHGRL